MSEREASPKGDDAVAVLRVADAVGALIEAWGFKRNMGRMWAVLYLSAKPLSAPELADQLGLSAGAVSMLLTELQQWNAVKQEWVVGERREYFAAETSIWKMVSRVIRERELGWVRTAGEAFAEAQASLGTPADPREALIAERVAGLAQLAAVGAGLLQSILEGEAVDSLPIKTVGELAKAVRK